MDHAASRAPSAPHPPQDPIAALLADPPALPVTAGLERLRAALSAGPYPCAVLLCPPGTGKTTLVPPLVADVLAHTGAPRPADPAAPAAPAASGPASPAAPGRVIVTEPRRVAARAAARRIASLLGEPVGRSVGYAVRGEQRTSAATRIEIVTAGLLVRRLQSDPELSGVGAIVLDEVHERFLESDLLLTLLLDARVLREDLIIVAMSATADVHRLPAVLGADERVPAPVIEVSSAIHPLQERFAPPPTGVARLDAGGVPRPFLTHVARTTAQVLDDPTAAGDVLVFVPGAREVEEVRRQLLDLVPDDVDVHVLHGRLAPSAQDAALAPSPAGRRRVVVATAVAESSLTVPGVRVVVDATLSREPRTDHGSGTSGLVTVGVSRSSGIQRAGRAGREGPGVVVRCCSPVDWARAAPTQSPEILTADLTRTAVELAAWGSPLGQGLTWIDQPPRPALEAALARMRHLGVADADGALTPLGRAVAAVPAPVGVATALVRCAPVVGPVRAAQVAAALSAQVRVEDADLAGALRRWRRDEGGQGDGRLQAWREETERLLGALAGLDAPGPRTRADERAGQDLDAGVGLVCAQAAPWWIAHRRGTPTGGEDVRYLTASGLGLRLPAGSPLAQSAWLAVGACDRRPGTAEAVIRAAAPLEEDTALEVGADQLSEDHELRWEGDQLRAVTCRRLGAIVLGEAPQPAPSASLALRALRERCQDEGLQVLPWGDGAGSAAELRARLALLRAALGDPWPDVSEDALLARAEEWLAPSLARACAAGRPVSLARLDLVAGLRALLPWPEAGRLEELAPSRLRVPSGASAAVRYLDERGQGLERPVVAVRLQECFGWEETPTLADGAVRVVLHLLSPAQRPVAVTDDLRSFWAGPYEQVRRELRGRYPKHAWPEDPWSAPPTRVGRGR